MEHITTERIDQDLVIRILDEEIKQYETAEKLGAEMRSAAEDDSQRVIVDFSRVRFLASVGYGPLISLRKLMDEKKKHLVLCGLSAQLHEVFVATRMLINPRAEGFGFVTAPDVEAARLLEL